MAVHVEVLQEPRRLQRGDERSAFRSGNAELDDWFHRFAWQNQDQGNTVVYVAVQGTEVLGYYALSTASVTRTELPSSLAPRRRPEPCPCILLARLAVDERAQGMGIGSGLLRDAFARSLEASRIIGAAALLVHCTDGNARGFYLANAEFEASPASDMQLMVSLRAMRRLLGSSA